MTEDYVIQALEQGRILVVDELDSSIHFKLTRAIKVIIFGNLCTMQIITKHWTDGSLNSPAKSVNAPLVKEFTGVENYKGRADQIDTVTILEHS